jgi:putative ABC transport system substrate-binding protein
VHAAADLERVIAEAGREAEGGLIVVPDSFMFGQRDRITALAAKYRLPAMYPLGIFIPDGGLIAYGIDRIDMFHRTADYVDRILRGASPVELPVQGPTKFELAINLKTAKALGLSVPPSMLLSATEVIE